MTKRRPTKDEAELFRRALADAKPLTKTARSARRIAPTPETPASDRETSATPAARASSPPPRLSGSAAPSLMPGRLIGLDKSTGERLFKGQMTIEGRLDLHGLTQAQAHDRLQDFLSRQARAGARCLLIVTGKGAAGGGVLKENVPRWLNEPALRRYLVAFGWAQPRHGGQGALYVLLKRNREETR